MIRLSGIFRPVFLYSVPAVHLRDFTLTTPLRDNYTNADLAVKVSVRNRGAQQSGTYSVEVQLYDANRQAVWPSPLRVPVNVGAVPVGQDATAQGSQAVQARSSGRPSTRTSTPPCCNCATRPARSPRPRRHGSASASSRSRAA